MLAATLRRVVVRARGANKSNNRIPKTTCNKETGIQTHVRTSINMQSLIGGVFFRLGFSIFFGELFVPFFLHWCFCLSRIAFWRNSQIVQDVTSIAASVNRSRSAVFLPGCFCKSSRFLCAFQSIEFSASAQKSLCQDALLKDFFNNVGARPGARAYSLFCGSLSRRRNLQPMFCQFEFWTACRLEKVKQSKWSKHVFFCFFLL